MSRSESSQQKKPRVTLDSGVYVSIEEYEEERRLKIALRDQFDELWAEKRELVEQFEALAKVILEADERTQQPIDLNYIAIFKDDWHRIVGKVTPPAKLADLFVSNPATSSEGALSEQAREPVSRGALPSEAHVPASVPPVIEGQMPAHTIPIQPCDGSTSCEAETHIHGCFAEESS